MKTFSDIYKSVTESLNKRLGVTITRGSLIDNYVSAASEPIAEAHRIIEDNKTPHIYTGLKGADIDKYGYLVNCPREKDETDQTYLTRCMAWTYSNQAANEIAITMALANLKYSSNATYVPYTQGVGTGTVYIIPLDYDNKDIVEKSIEEVKTKLQPILSPDAYVEYKAPRPIRVKLSIYFSSEAEDIKALQSNLEKSIKQYINSIPIGEYLSYGQINKIGINEPKIDFFNVTHIFLGESNELMSTLNHVQTIEEKFLFDSITWRQAVE